MNDQINETPTLRVIVNRIADLIDRRLQPSDVASLRRLKPDDIDSPAFWRIAAVELEQALDASGPIRDQRELRWAAIIQTLAISTASMHRVESWDMPSLKPTFPISAF